MTCEQLESHTEPSDRTIDDYDHDNGSSSPYLLGSYDKPIIYSIETLEKNCATRLFVYALLH